MTLVGVTGDTRVAVLPDVATLSGQGQMDDAFRIMGWVGMAAPAKTPEAIVQRLAHETAAAFKDPAVRQRISDLGFTPMAGTPEQFRAIHEIDLPIWAALVKDSGAKLD